MENLPVYIYVLFGLTTLLTLLIFFKATRFSKKIMVAIVAWMILQTAISVSGFYTITSTLPPRFMLLLLPPLICIAFLFLTQGGKKFIDQLDIKALTLLHIVRVPVEITLLWIFLYKGIPGIMTFEGRNFDILSGLSAPLIYYFGFIKNKPGRKVILIWNFICMALLINIVALAILSAPFPFQKLGFEQPNVAILYFPFVWLPCVIVPMVLFSHLVVIRRLLVTGKQEAVGKLAVQ